MHRVWCNVCPLARNSLTGRRKSLAQRKSDALLEPKTPEAAALSLLEYYRVCDDSHRLFTPALLASLPIPTTPSMPWSLSHPTGERYLLRLDTPSHAGYRVAQAEELKRDRIALRRTEDQRSVVQAEP